jgi:hypothetical protein
LKEVRVARRLEAKENGVRRHKVLHGVQRISQISQTKPLGWKDVQCRWERYWAVPYRLSRSAKGSKSHQPISSSLALPLPRDMEAEDNSFGKTKVAYSLHHVKTTCKRSERCSDRNNSADVCRQGSSSSHPDGQSWKPGTMTEKKQFAAADIHKRYKSQCHKLPRSSLHRPSMPMSQMCYRCPHRHHRSNSHHCWVTHPQIT